MARRQKRLTKRERKALDPARTERHAHSAQHIHCIACGRHLDPEGFDSEPPDALFLTCQHGSQFPACAGCEVEARHRLAEHDRSGQPVKMAAAWH